MGREPLIVLSCTEQRELERLLATTRNQRDHQRIHAVLKLAEGDAPEDVADALSVGLASIYRWVERYRVARCASDLLERPRSGRPLMLAGIDDSMLRQLLRQKPQSFGYRSNGWTVALLCTHLKQHFGVLVSADTMRRRLHRMNQRWKRPKHVYYTTDPRKGQKKGASFQR